MAMWKHASLRLCQLADTARRERLFMPSGTYGTRPKSHILILEEGPNPTTDYYLRPRLPPPDLIPTTVVNLASNPASAPFPPGTFLIIVRYVNRIWARHLSRHRDLLSGAAYLMDDDLPAAWRANNLPLRYRWKIQRLFLSKRRVLGELCDRVWLANQHLADKYADCGATVLPPLPLPRIDARPATVSYFYHGSASHRLEHAWLADIVRAVQREMLNLTFVTVGDSSIRKLYAGIPRVLVLHPISWPNYVGALPVMRHDIGLAPLLEAQFNRGRSHTKFFDITRLGAVGVYSDTPTYRQFVRNGKDGLLVENDPIAWREAILALARSAGRRAEILTAATQRTEQTNTDVVPFY